MASFSQKLGHPRLYRELSCILFRGMLSKVSCMLLSPLHPPCDPQLVTEMGPCPVPCRPLPPQCEGLKSRSSPERRQPKGRAGEGSRLAGDLTQDMSHPTASQQQKVEAPSPSLHLGASPRRQTSPPAQPTGLLHSTRSRIKLTNNHTRIVFFWVSDNQSHARVRGRETCWRKVGKTPLQSGAETSRALS